MVIRVLPALQVLKALKVRVDWMDQEECQAYPSLAFQGGMALQGGMATLDGLARWACLDILDNLERASNLVSAHLIQKSVQKGYTFNSRTCCQRYSANNLAF